jgi:hypothetical protein
LNHDLHVMPIQEGFAPESTQSKTKSKTKPQSKFQPTAAGQVNLSRTAGMADGSSNNQYLLDHLLKKHDRLAEAFENRDADKSRSRVSATTTKKKGLDQASTPVTHCSSSVAPASGTKAFGWLEPSLVPLPAATMTTAVVTDRGL